MELTPVKGPGKPGNYGPVSYEDLETLVSKMLPDYAYCNKNLYEVYLSIAAESGNLPISKVVLSRTLNLRGDMESWHTNSMRGFRLKQNATNA